MNSLRHDAAYQSTSISELSRIICFECDFYRNARGVFGLDAVFLKLIKQYDDTICGYVDFFLLFLWNSTTCLGWMWYNLYYLQSCDFCPFASHVYDKFCEFTGNLWINQSESEIWSTSIYNSKYSFECQNQKLEKMCTLVDWLVAWTIPKNATFGYMYYFCLLFRLWFTGAVNWLYVYFLSLELIKFSHFSIQSSNWAKYLMENSQ